MNANPASDVLLEARTGAVVRSALWAAAGDALGWITELVPEQGVRRRTGGAVVKQPVPWSRMIGGRGGVTVELPAGTYSDDTQLRLAVSRCIRGNGTFDVEAFARVELTVWQSYALGAGLGSKAAASNLSKRGVNWFSNFFETKGASYMSGGGNGAAMRIQPHVWSARRRQTLLLDTLRDAIVTHGHPHGFCGAFIHAYCLAETLDGTGSHSPIETLYHAVDQFAEIHEYVATDRQLDAFWRPLWEKSAGRTLQSAVLQAREETLTLLDSCERLASSEGLGAYHSVLETIGAFDPQRRGSGIITSAAAMIAVQLFKAVEPEEAISAISNTLGSDTDTIATMAGAIIGVNASRVPKWPIQDEPYLTAEAERLAGISLGSKREGFAYPDLARWTPPSTQSDAVLRSDGGLALAGFGRVRPIGQPYVSGDFTWQWLELQFGQTILAKRRGTEGSMGLVQEAVERRRGSYFQEALPLVRQKATERRDAPARVNVEPEQPKPRDWFAFAEAEVVRSKFDARVIGQLFNDALDRFGSTEAAVSFAAIIARARLR